MADRWDNKKRSGKRQTFFHLLSSPARVTLNPRKTPENTANSEHSDCHVGEQGGGILNPHDSSNLVKFHHPPRNNGYQIQKTLIEAESAACDSSEVCYGYSVLETEHRELQPVNGSADEFGKDETGDSYSREKDEILSLLGVLDRQALATVLDVVRAIAGRSTGPS